jgi:predicted metal-dependent RNase
MMVNGRVVQQCLISAIHHKTSPFPPTSATYTFDKGLCDSFLNAHTMMVQLIVTQNTRTRARFDQCAKMCMHINHVGMVPSIESFDYFFLGNFFHHMKQPLHSFLAMMKVQYITVPTVQHPRFDTKVSYFFNTVESHFKSLTIGPSMVGDIAPMHKTMPQCIHSFVFRPSIETKFFLSGEG